MNNIEEVFGVRVFKVNTDLGEVHIYVCPSIDRDDDYDGYLFSHCLNDTGETIEIFSEEFMAVVHAVVDEISDEGNILFDILKALPL